MDKSTAPLSDAEILEASASAEECLIGCALYDPSCIPSARAAFDETQDFQFVRNAWTWAAIASLYGRGDEVTPWTVADELRNQRRLDDVGGIDRLFNLQNSTLTARPATTYARIVERMAVKRAVLAKASEMAKAAYSADVDTTVLITSARESVDDLASRLKSSDQILDGSKLAADAMDEFEAWMKDPNPVRGLSSGIAELDKLLGGFEAGTVTGILAETSMGKSTLASGIVRAFAAQGPGLYVPTETPGKTAFHKMALDLAGIPFKRARSGALASYEQTRAYDAYLQIMRVGGNIKTFDSASPTMDAIAAKIAQMRVGAGCKWLVVDSGSKFAKSLKIASVGDNLYKATTLASGFLQDMARLGLVVLATWQIGRNTKERGAGGTGKEPTLHDAKDSGAVEEDVDVLLGLYRHDYFVNRGMADPNPSRYPPGTAKLILLKDRAGTDGDETITLSYEAGKGFSDFRRPATLSGNGYGEYDDN